MGFWELLNIGSLPGILEICRVEKNKNSISWNLFQQILDQTSNLNLGDVFFLCKSFTKNCSFRILFQQIVDQISNKSSLVRCFFFFFVFYLKMLKNAHFKLFRKILHATNLSIEMSIYHAAPAKIPCREPMLRIFRPTIYIFHVFFLPGKTT